MMNNAQLQERIESLREKPALLFGAMLGAGLIGAVIWRRVRGTDETGVMDTLTTSLKADDLEGVVREAARQGFEAGRAVERSAQVQKSKGPLGLSPQEWLAFVSVVVPLAKQVMDQVQAQRAKEAMAGGPRFESK